MPGRVSEACSVLGITAAQERHPGALTAGTVLWLEISRACRAS